MPDTADTPITTKPATVLVAARLPLPLYDQLVAVSAEEERSQSQIIRMALTAFFAAREARHG